MKLVDGEQMRRIDQEAQSTFGIPGIVLMENAAENGWQRYLSCRHCEPDDRNCRLVFLAGPGNNGGDALAMARHAFTDGRCVEAVLLRSELGELPDLHRRSLEALGVPVSVWPSERSRLTLQNADVLFDGLFGIGMMPPLRNEAGDLVRFVNEVSRYTVAIDAPSGVGDGFVPGYPAVKADLTLTFGLPKLALYIPAARLFCGRIEIVPAGFPPALLRDESIPAELVDDLLASRLCPKASAVDYKGSRGRVGVFAGSSATTGAAVLTASASARAGAGLVYLNVDPEIHPIIASKVTSIMTSIASADEVDNPERYDALLVGPGWGLLNREQPLERFISSDRSGVLDADALRLLSQIDSPPDLCGRWVLTPHPGELATLAGLSLREVLERPLDSLHLVCTRYSAVVVYKAYVTIIESPDGRRRIIDGMNPYLGTGGSGDVLAGIIAGLIARGATAFDAAAVGAYIHSEAGRGASGGGWFLAEDLLPYVSRITAKLGEESG